MTGLLCPHCGHHLHRPERCQWYECGCLPAAQPREEPENEAAERLRGWLSSDLDFSFAQPNKWLADALATERRLTVERIRERIEHLIVVDGIRGVDAIGTALDEEANR